MNLAIIPARGGSKRIPRKNIRMFHGRPVIEYAIQAALGSEAFGEVMVSTDDDEIASVAKAAGAHIPFRRSIVNSGDHAATDAVIAEVLSEYAKIGQNFEYVCCIYPTAALATANHLRQGLKLLTDDDSLTAVVPIVRFGYPVQRALIVRKGRIPMRQPEYYDARSQELEPCYHDAGQWYWLRVEKFFRRPELLGPNCAGLVVGEMEAQDIDNEDDWRIAELKFALARRTCEREADA